MLRIGPIWDVEYATERKQEERLEKNRTVNSAIKIEIFGSNNIKFSVLPVLKTKAVRCEENRPVIALNEKCIISSHAQFPRGSMTIEIQTNAKKPILSHEQLYTTHK